MRKTLSANDGEMDCDIEANCDDYKTKPGKVSQLLGEVTALLAGRPTP